MKEQGKQHDAWHYSDVLSRKNDSVVRSKTTAV